jgi:hypothetical protein
VPSGDPTPYSISSGWNAKELDLGTYCDGQDRVGGIVSPVGVSIAERVVERASDCTIVFCVFQFVCEHADELARASALVVLGYSRQAYLAKTPA